MATRKDSPLAVLAMTPTAFSPSRLPNTMFTSNPMTGKKTTQGAK
jgi:hypothetical protein